MDNYREQAKEFNKVYDKILTILVDVCKQNGIESTIIGEAELKEIINNFVREGKLSEKYSNLIQDIQGLKEMVEGNIKNKKGSKWEYDMLISALNSFNHAI